MGVTGVRSEIKTDLPSLVSMVKNAAAGRALPAAKLPVAVGFGIHSKAQAVEIGKIADGIIVGSAIVKIVEEYGEHAGNYIYDYVKGMKEAAG
jgi:tryptophan synthase alpha chain